jgi:hypothetical protein
MILKLIVEFIFVSVLADKFFLFYLYQEQMLYFLEIEFSKHDKSDLIFIFDIEF